MEFESSTKWMRLSMASDALTSHRTRHGACHEGTGCNGHGITRLRVEQMTTAPPNWQSGKCDSSTLGRHDSGLGVCKTVREFLPSPLTVFKKKKKRKKEKIFAAAGGNGGFGGGFGRGGRFGGCGGSGRGGNDGNGGRWGGGSRRHPAGVDKKARGASNRLRQRANLIDYLQALRLEAAAVQRQLETLDEEERLAAMATTAVTTTATTTAAALI
ncbi:hypothetical protein CLAIMM_12314 isoform 3 [Cladophialophora immunda]|nr:hypothetical protein CLAIMM_12314 isoform 3 [Cladophialophora immunda]